MKATDGKRASGVAWEEVSGRMKVVRLTAPVQILIPALIFPSLSSSTRGITFIPGRFGLLVGVSLVVASVLVGFMLTKPAGILGGFVSVWFLGTAGIATIVGVVRPTAYVKPICVRCRLLPVIKEHEAIHLTGVTSEKQVWASMRTRHSVESLGLEGDPAICSFCPIPKRLAEH
jgi:hypothetical protein